MGKAWVRIDRSQDLMVQVQVTEPLPPGEWAVVEYNKEKVLVNCPTGRVYTVTGFASTEYGAASRHDAISLTFTREGDYEGTVPECTSLFEAVKQALGWNPPAEVAAVRETMLEHAVKIIEDVSKRAGELELALDIKNIVKKMCDGVSW